jgi:tripartite-type tricarboxylate transporter receptor subunit TctC
LKEDETKGRFGNLRIGGIGKIGQFKKHIKISLKGGFGMEEKIKFGLLCLVCLLLNVFLSPLMANGADTKYPIKPLRLIVPFAAGGPTDVVCRKLAELAGKDLGQEIIVENKTGMGGAVGSRFVAFSKTDGYTIGSLGSASVVVAPHMGAKLDFDPVTDFSFIAQYAVGDHPLAVAAQSPLKTFKDFMDEGRKRQITYGGMELIAASIAVNRMASIAKINLKLVPFGGAAPAITACLGGHTDAVVSSGLYEYVRSGKLRLLAQTGEDRNKEFPDVPTLKELGYDAESRVFYGIIAPKGLPEPIRARLEKAFTSAIQDPSLSPILHNASYTLMYRNGKDFSRYVKEAFDISQKEFQEMGLGKYAKEKK